MDYGKKFAHSLTHSLLTPYKKFFIVLLCFLFVLLLGGIKLLPDFLSDGFVNLTGGLVVLFSNGLGIPAFYKDGFVTVSGFRMRLVFECAALHFLAILTIGILLYPGHTLRYKAKGIILGNLFIILINTLRIVLLGVVGARFPSVFDFTHNYLWQGTFAIVVFLIYLIWVERSFLTMPRLKFSGIFLISSAISVFAIGFIIEPYIGFLAKVSDKFVILTWPLSISDKLLLLTRTDGLSIIAVGNEILYRGKMAGQIFYFSHYVNVFDSAVFIGLMTASMVGRMKMSFPQSLGGNPALRQAQGDNGVMVSLSNHGFPRIKYGAGSVKHGMTGSRGFSYKNTKMILSGIGVLMFLHLFFVSGIGFLMREGASNGLMNSILWVSRGISIVTPILLWFFLKKSSQFPVYNFQKSSTKNLKLETQNWSLTENQKLKTAFKEGGLW